MTSDSRQDLSGLPIYTVEVDGNNPKWLAEWFEDEQYESIECTHRVQHVPLVHFFPFRRGTRVVRCTLVKLTNVDYSDVLYEFERLGLTLPDRPLTERFFDQLNKKRTGYPVVSLCGCFHSDVVFNHWSAYGYLVRERGGKRRVEIEDHLRLRFDVGYFLGVIDQVFTEQGGSEWSEVVVQKVRTDQWYPDSWCYDMYKRYQDPCQDPYRKDVQQENQSLRNIIDRVQAAISLSHSGPDPKPHKLSRRRRVRYASVILGKDRGTHDVAWMAQRQCLSFPDIVTADAILRNMQPKIAGLKQKVVVCFLEGDSRHQNGYFYITVNNEGVYGFGHASIYSMNFHYNERGWKPWVEFVGVVEEL